MPPVTQAAKVDEVICGRSDSQVDATKSKLRDLSQKPAIEMASSDFKFIETVHYLVNRRKYEVHSQIVDLQDSIFPPVEDLRNAFTKGYVRKVDRLISEYNNLNAQSDLVQEIRKTAIAESGSGKMEIQTPEKVFKQKELPTNFEMAKHLRTDQFCEASEEKFKVIDLEVQARSKYITSLRTAVQALEKEPKISQWVNEARKLAAK